MSVNVVKGSLNEINSQLIKCKDAHYNYILLLDETEADAEIQWLSTLQTANLNINVKGGRYIETKAESTKKDSAVTSTLRLETMKMPCFNGQIRDYPRFKTDFEKHVLPEIKPESVAYVLKSCLRDEPLEIVKNVDHDVDDMWSRLSDRYGRISKFVDVVMFDIKQLKVVPDGDDKRFLGLVNVVERVYRDLVRIKMEGEISNSTTVSMIEERLPRIIRREWSREVSRKDSAVSDGNKFSSLLEFLLEQRRAIEYDSDEFRSISRSAPSRTHYVNNVAVDTLNEVKADTEDWKNKQVDCWIHATSSHSIESCKFYLDKAPDERVKYLTENRACYSCLRVGHRSSQCYFKRKCGVEGCNRNHHSSLHLVNNFKAVQLHTQSKVVNASTCLLQLMRIPCAAGFNSSANVLWDGGATLSMITFKKAKELQLKGVKVKLTIIKVGGEKEDIESCQYNVPLRDKNEQIVNFVAYGIKQISTPLQRIDLNGVTHLFNDVVEGEVERPEGEVDILIGFEYAGYHPERQQSVQHLLLMKNIFGSCLGGSHRFIEEKTQTVVKDAFVNHARISVEDFYRNESMGVDCNPQCGGCRCGECPIGGKQFTLKEERELAMIENGLEFRLDHWIAKYPWKRDPKDLPNNRAAAFAMLIGTEKRLQKNEIHAKMYQEQIQDMLERGAARKLSNTEIKEYDGPRFYICHHDVLKPSSESTPCRIVFNSSARFANHVLNDYWVKGPNLMNNLLGLLIRFREGNVAVTGDIRKMYHAVKISEVDQHTHRFLWRDLETFREPDEYVMTCVSFGDKPAGTIAAVALRNTAKMKEHEYPNAAAVIYRNSYVDDIIDSFSSVQDAKVTTEQLDEILQLGGFSIKKWVISGEEAEVDEVTSISVAGTDTSISKVLGVAWNPREDSLIFQVKLNFSAKRKCVRVEADLEKKDLPSKIPMQLTRRMVLSQVNGIYDPLGIATPFTIKAKLLLRNLCSHEKELGWDDPIPHEEWEEWVEFFTELFQMEDIRFERCVKPEDAVGDPILVMFSDASEKAFGACAYVRWRLRNGKFNSKLLTAKSRVAPLKKITIVRLELNAAVLAKRLKVFIERESRLHFENHYFIVDSEIVRAMISKESYGFNTFAGVRIGEIQESTSPDRWFWIEGKYNVADMITRGRSPDELGIDSIWQQGPEFMKLPEGEWPIKNSYSGEYLPEQVKVVMNVEIRAAEGISNVIDINRYSSYTRMLRVSARVWNAFRRTPIPSFRNISKTPNVGDIEKVELMWVTDAQTEVKKQVESGKLVRLCPTVREDGIIVVGGRVERWVEMTYNNLQPILLPYKHRLSRLYAEYVHDKDHLGVAATTCKIRLKFWITRLMQMVKSIRYRCVRCRTLDKRMQNQIMGTLPEDRLKPAPAWSRTSLDFFGPFETRGETNKRSRGKAYGIIFNCMLSRAVHIDVATDYSTDGFLLVLRRFMSIRGCPEKLHSDRGSQLVAADKEMRKILQEHNIEKLKEFGAENGIEWDFSPPDAPWRNGCSEALIKSVKRAIFTAMGSQVLQFSALQTLFFESANIVNERPIGRKSHNPDEISYLCPNDLLLGRATSRIPSGPFRETKNPRKRHEFVQQMVDAFWKKWVRDFFPSLIVRQKWHTKRRNVKEGDIVLIQDSNMVRGKWKLGRVAKATMSDDGMVRSVEVQYKVVSSDKDKGKMSLMSVERPIQKLIVIVPVDGEKEEDEEILETDGDS